jgi:mono/diheme cytochrome c family protein
MSIRRWALLCLAAAVFGTLALSGCSANPANVPVSSDEEKQRRVAPTRPAGADVYSEHCARCHGQEGQGMIGPKIRPPRLNGDEVFAVIADGRPGTQMPAFRGVLSEDSVDSVIDYLVD